MISKDYLRAPDNKPYNLSVSLAMFLHNPVLVPDEVDKLVFRSQLKHGFFIEAGANDAESDSDSLHFELNHGWSGLLVEPNPFLYSRALMKHRKATLIKTCLSTEAWPTFMAFDMSSNSLQPENPQGWIQCLPLYSILLALGNPTVHCFSLDIEGAEFPVLKTIPWEKVDIQVKSYILTMFSMFNFERICLDGKKNYIFAVF
jgi:hypothetical protein